MAPRRNAFIRARKAAGFTQERLAAALGVERTTIGRWEAGDYKPLPYKLPKLAKLLRITPVQLAEFFEDPAPVPSDDGVASGPRKRRTLRKWVVAASARGDAALDYSKHIGMSDVARLERATDRLHQMDCRHGGETLWQAGVAAMRSAQAMLEHGTYTASVGQALLRATGNVHIRTGWLACDAGQHAVARASFSEALTVGQQANDREIEMRALAGLGFHSNLNGKPREGLRFSRAAAQVAESFGSSRMVAVPLLSAAVAGARSNDFTEARASIAQARKTLDSDKGSDLAPWAEFMSEMEIDAVEATCFSERGDGAKAEKLLEQAIATYGDNFARNIALYRARLTLARVQAGVVDGAVISAHEVLDTVDAGLESWRVNMEFRRAMRSLVKYSTVSVVAELGERYRATIC